MMTSMILLSALLVPWSESLAFPAHHPVQVPGRGERILVHTVEVPPMFLSQPNPVSQICLLAEF